MTKEPMVLLVDDEREFLDAITSGLDGKGFKITCAEGAAQGLTALEKFTPDIIIADLRMHPMNGFEFFQQVKKNEHLKHIPFIFLTGVKDELAEKYGMTLGAEAYFVKPVDLDILEKSIKHYLGHR
jgi:DNA-binding response OmpR family regulator